MKRCGRGMRRRQLAAVAVAVAVTGALLASVAAAASEVTVQADSGAFSDDDGSVHEAGLNALAARGLLEGTECGEGRICPSRPLKRWEMAVWLGRVLGYGEPEPITESRFADVDVEDWWAPHVERFAGLGITAGCATEPLRYCPQRAVNRAQMATFLKHALRLPEAAPAGFADTEGNTHEDSIDALAAEGITAGCSTELMLYCPKKSVTRAQMATFLSSALGLLPSSREPLSAQEVYARVAPSIPIVVSAYGHGSGILIPGDYVLTNHHVVWPNDFDHTARIVFPDGTEYVDVPVVATNPWADIAVLGPLETDKRPLPLADGEQLPPGSDLYLIGYPGEFEQHEGSAPEPAITRGLLSRVRHWDGYDLTLLQTDAAIAGGQSGGALVDGRGWVVGVSTWRVIDWAFGLATSASDDATIVDLMLTEPGFSSSFHEGVNPDDDIARVWDIELAGPWDRATFFVEEVTESIDLVVEGSGEPWLWMADTFDGLIGLNADGEPVASGSAEIDADGLYFVEVGQLSAGAASYTLTSSAALQPYHDADGTVLLADDETSYGLAGTFDYSGDIDTYELHLRRGETVAIWTDSILTDTGLDLYDSASNIVATDSDSGPLSALGLPINAGIEFEAPSTGTYYLTVYAEDADARGGYIVNAAILS